MFPFGLFSGRLARYGISLAKTQLSVTSSRDGVRVRYLKGSSLGEVVSTVITHSCRFFFPFSGPRVAIAVTIPREASLG